MIGLIAGAGFFGYLLLYAAVAHGGRYAARPWDALTDTGPAGSSPGAGGVGGHQSILGKILGLAHWLPIGLPGLPGLP